MTSSRTASSTRLGTDVALKVIQGQHSPAGRHDQHQVQAGIHGRIATGRTGVAEIRGRMRQRLTWTARHSYASGVEPIDIRTRLFPVISSDLWMCSAMCAGVFIRRGDLLPLSKWHLIKTDECCPGSQIQVQGVPMTSILFARRVARCSVSNRREVSYARMIVGCWKR